MFLLLILHSLDIMDEISLYRIIPFDVIQNAEQILHRFGSEHGDTGFLEVGDALEHGRVGQVSSDMKNAPTLVQ